LKRIALLAALSLAGCGSDSQPAEPPRSAASIDIVDFKYAPARVEVAPGARVTFTNRDRAPHTATATGAPGRFDTGTLRQGERDAVTLTRPGTYDYVCELHPFMKASIVVDG
jgi:plastocyanin